MSDAPKKGRILRDLTEPPPPPPPPRDPFFDLPPPTEEELRETRELLEAWAESEQELEQIKKSRPLGATGGWEPRSIHAAPRSRRDPNAVSGGLPSLGKRR